MKQIYMNSPTHANVNLCSGASTPDHSGDFGTINKSLTYRGPSMKSEDQPRASMDLPRSNNPFRK